MPQGFYLGPLIFLVLINDLTAGCLLRKFVDDTTLSEIIPKGETCSNMSSSVEDILHWSQCNLMNINWNKTKELVLGSDLDKKFCQELCADGNIVERVSVFKLLGVSWPQECTVQGIFLKSLFLLPIVVYTICYLLHVQILYTDWQHLPYIPQIPKTSRYYYSFIPYAINNYMFPSSQS